MIYGPHAPTTVSTSDGEHYICVNCGKPDTHPVHSLRDGSIKKTRLTRAQQVAKHKANLDQAFEAARQGRVINLSALIGGAEEILTDDPDSKIERDEPYSNGWQDVGSPLRR